MSRERGRDQRQGRGRISRRTFLASSGGLAAGAAVVGAAPGIESQEEAVAAAPSAPQLAARSTTDTTGPAGTGQARLLRPQSLTVNGSVDPIGVDPDDCSFAWTLSTTGREPERGAVQTAWHIVVRRTDPGHTGTGTGVGVGSGSGSGSGSGTVWDSGPVESARQAFVPYAGAVLSPDAAYAWTVKTRNRDGRWSAPSTPASFATSLRDTDWQQAAWLQPSAASTQPDRVTYLRTVVTPPSGTIGRATAYLSAAHTYRFEVNGAAVDAWPSFSYPDEQYVRAADLTGRIRPGRANALGVLHRWYGPGQGRPASAPGLLVLVSLHYADGRHVVYGSDGTWRELAAEWLPSPQRNADVGDFVEWIDGRAHPQGWSEPTYDDRDWSPVTVIGPAGTAEAAPFTHTYAQRTHIAETTVEPVRLHTLADGSIVADFGAVYAARPRVDFATGTAGQTVSMHVGYLLDPDGHVSTLHGTQETNLSFTYIMRDGPQSFEAFTFLGFRYLQIDNAAQALGRGQVAALARHTAMPAAPMATFSSGNRMLDAVWRVNAHSCLYCSQEQFIDTPTREKGPFLWDGANESEAVMRCYGEQNLTWQALRDVERGQARYWSSSGQTNAVYPNGDGARFFATSAARYVEWLWRYYLGTGDLVTTARLFPSVSLAVSWLWSARNVDSSTGSSFSTGLLYGLADTSNGDPEYDYDLNVAADTASNVLAVNAFNRVAQIAMLTDDPAGAALWQSRAAQLSNAVNATLRRSDGIYVDGVDASGALSGHASQEANALALAYGVVPASDVAAIGAYVAGLGIAVQPNHGLELLRGLAGAAMPQAMVHTLTDTSIPGWAHSVASGGTFTWEVWRPSDLIGDSLSHGWGSSALVAMQETLLGVTYVEPGADGSIRLGVAPPAAGLPKASGLLPTPAGQLTLSWQRKGSGITMLLVVPTNASAMVRLPSSDPAAVRESGHPAAQVAGVSVVSTHDGMAVLAVGSGSYRFTTP